MTYWALVASVLLLVVNGFFVAVEFALVASRRPKLEQMAEDGSWRSRMALAGVVDLQRQLGGAQLGITIASLVLGFLAEPAVAHLIEPIFEQFGLHDAALHTVSFILALALVVFLHMVLGEMVPKNLAIAAPESSLLWLAPVHRVFVVVFGPIIWFLNLLANGVMALLRIEPADEIGTAHTASEFAFLVNAARQEGLIEEFDHTLLTGALDFGELTAQSVMIPRSNVEAVTRSMTIEQVEQVIVTSGHSRLPVCGRSLDDVLGYVHAKDLLRLPAEARNDAVPLELIRRMLKVRADMLLEDLLIRMRQRQLHFAVVETSGVTVGIVTLEDVLEELVGDIEDETDR